LVVVFEEMGRSLLCAPDFSSVALAANLLPVSADVSAQKDYLPPIADGTKIATVAFAESSGRWDKNGITLAAQRDAGEWTLTGEKMYVLDGCTADLVLVAARTTAGISVFAVDKGATGLVATGLATMDQTRKQARLTFDATPARLIGIEDEGWEAISKTLDLAVVALAAEEVGGGAKGTRDVRRVREKSGSIRPPDRKLSSHQT
jgi:alkylation response protein AidB-like acyl-CoA dehydrogenase